MEAFCLWLGATWSWAAFNWIMYIGSMMVLWWCIGNDEDSGSINDPFIALLFTVSAPIWCFMYLLSWCRKNGERYTEVVAEREQRKRERKNEVGFSDSQIDRLGVHDR